MNKEKKKKLWFSMLVVFMILILLLGSSYALLSRATQAEVSSVSNTDEIEPNSVSENEIIESAVSDSISENGGSSEITSSEGQTVSSEIEYEVEDSSGEIIPRAVFAETDDTVTVTAENFLEYFSVNGSSSFDSSTGIITLTQDKTWQAGTVTLKVKISQKQSFNLTGEINLGNKANSAGADGIAIGFHTGATTQIGSNGEGLGVAGLPKSFGSKWDTFYNSGDPMHNAFLTLYYTNPSTPSRTSFYNVNPNGPTKISEPTANRFVPFSIIYDGNTQIYTVTYNDPSIGEITRSAKISDLQTNLGENDPLTLIMSAGTGSRCNLQQVKSMNFQFTPVGVVNEYYVDEAGATLYTARQSSASVPAIKGETLTLSYENKLTNQPYLDGYDYVKSTTGSINGSAYSNQTIPFTNAEQSVYHIFKKGIGTVNFVAKNLQNEILGTGKTTTGSFHTSYSFTPESIEGYTYIGLESGSAALTGKYGKAEQKITALYGKNLVVKFEPNGGTGVSNINVVESQKISSPTAPTKTGYIFAGWFIDKELNQEMAFSTSITQNMTLYAKWSNTKYSVIFNGNASNGGSMQNQEFAYDIAQNLEANQFTKIGYHFGSWNTKLNGSGVKYADQESVKNLVETNNGTIELYSQWEPNNYIVIFNGNSMTSGVMTNQTFTFDTAQNLKTNSFQKDGYTFNGWNTQADGMGVSYSEGQNISNLTTENGGKITLYALWKANEYTVNFNGNGSTSGAMASQSFVYDVEQSLAVNAYSKNGYTFSGWNTKANGSGETYTDKSNVENLINEKNGTITLYAQWQVNKFEMVFNGNGSTDTPMQSQLFEFDKEQALSKNTYTKTGYVFGGWNSEKNGSGIAYTDEQVVKNLTATNHGSVNLYAQWIANKYTVTFDKNKATSGNMADQTFIYDQEAKLNKSQLARTGYTFIGWNDKANGSGTNYTDEHIVKNLTSSVNGNVKLYAQWSGENQSIKFNANGGTTSQEEIVKGTGSNVDLSKVKNAKLDGYTFDGWWDSKVGGNPMPSTVEMPAGGITYFAHWKANKYDIIFDGNGSSLGAMPQQNFIYDIAQNLNKNQYKKIGYIFNGWNTSENGSGTAFADEQSVQNLTIDPSGKVILYAQWKEISYEVQFSGNTATSGNIAPQNFVYDTKQKLSINSFSKTGYRFVGWNTQANGTGTSYSDQQEVLNLSSIQNSTVILYAQWAPNSYFVAFTGNGSTSGTMDKQPFTFDEITSLQENKYQKDGHTFTGWNSKNDGSGVAYANEQNISNLTDEYNGTVTLYAQWSANSYVLKFNNQGGDITPSDQTIVYGQKASKPSSNPFKYGHVFSGWDRKPDGGSLWDFDNDVMPSSNTILYAQYIPNPHTVTFDYNDGAKEAQKQVVSFGTEIPQPEEPKLFGYAFIGWYDENGIAWNFSTLMPDEDVRLIAHWQHVEYTLTYLTYDLKEISSYTLYAGDEMPTERADSVPGHYFVGWGIDGTDSEYWNFGENKTMPDKNLILVALYDKDKHPDSSSKTNSASTNSRVYPSGSMSSSKETTPPNSSSQSIIEDSSSSSEIIISNPTSSRNEISSTASSPAVTINGNWSILSLILIILGGITSVISIFFVVKKGRQFNHKALALLSGLWGIAALIVFLFTTNFSGQAQFVNNQTIIYVISVLVQIFLLAFGFGKNKKNKNENDFLDDPE